VLISKARGSERQIEANLRFANLTEADLSGTDLSRADFGEANLSAANLAGSRLEGTNLEEALLVCANLKNVENLTHEQIELAITDNTTELPYYLRATLREEE
jgi:uncharacterized protein YjbI with pentapeptide repeats